MRQKIFCGVNFEEYDGYFEQFQGWIKGVTIIEQGIIIIIDLRIKVLF